MNNPFKPALTFSDRAILPLAERLRQHQALLASIRDALPPALAGALSACVVSGKKLILYSHSAAWTSQLRFHSDAVLAAAKTAGHETLTSVVTRIQPLLEEYPKSRRTARLPAKVLIEELRNAARGVTDDDLKRALARLSATLGRLQEEAADRDD